MRKVLKFFGFVGLAITALAAASALSNLGLPEHSRVVERLSETEKARAAEAFHLREKFGGQVWPGWDQAEIPLILHNEEYAFLLRFPGQPAAGWTMTPSGEHRGKAWEPVQGDIFSGETYYRQRLPDSGKTPENFTVRVGDQWAATLMTREYARIRMADEMQEEFPPLIARIIPYRLVWKVLLGASETYLGGILHESFHAFQGQEAYDRFAAAENIHSWEEDYPWSDQVFRQEWQEELDLLAEAVSAASVEESRGLAREFLDQRDQRRDDFDLSPQLMGYERNLEWLEGLAKYVELEIQRTAGAAPGYQPMPEIREDPNFSNYETRERYWNQQVKEIQRTAGREGDSRFYYTGFAQAVLLDRLRPDWKEHIWQEGIWLEDLLRSAVKE